MRKTSGQALVEFILILPVFVLFISATIDIGKILYEKYRLQNDLDIIKELHEQNQEQEMNRYANEKKLTISYQEKTPYLILTITKKIDIMTPGLSHILSNPYPIKESLTIIHETKS